MKTQIVVATRFWVRCSAWDWLSAILQQKGKYCANTSWPTYTRIEFKPAVRSHTNKRGAAWISINKITTSCIKPSTHLEGPFTFPHHKTPNILHHFYYWMHYFTVSTVMPSCVCSVSLSSSCSFAFAFTIRLSVFGLTEQNIVESIKKLWSALS